MKLEDEVQNVLTLVRFITEPPLREVLDQIVASCPDKLRQRVQPFSRKDQLKKPYRKMNEKALKTLNHNLKFAMEQLERVRSQMEDTIDEGFFYEDLFNSQESPERVMDSWKRTPED